MLLKSAAGLAGVAGAFVEGRSPRRYPYTGHVALHCHCKSGRESRMGKGWDEFKKAAGDQLRGSLKYGASTSYRHNRAAMEAARQERIERERLQAAMRMEMQIRAWEHKLGGTRGTIKSVYKPEQGFTDVYYGGIGEPDGPGHGHIRVWEDGTERIVREPYIPGQDGAKREATLLDDWTKDRRAE